MTEPDEQLTFLHEFKDTDEKLELIEKKAQEKLMKVITEVVGG